MQPWLQLDTAGCREPGLQSESPLGPPSPSVWQALSPPQGQVCRPWNELQAHQSVAGLQGVISGHSLPRWRLRWNNHYTEALVSIEDCCSSRLLRTAVIAGAPGPWPAMDKHFGELLNLRHFACHFSEHCGQQYLGPSKAAYRRPSDQLHPTWSELGSPSCLLSILDHPSILMPGNGPRLWGQRW